MAIEVIGTNEVIAHLEKLQDTSILAGAINKCCLLVERTAKEKAPSSTGELRNSIQSEVESGANSVEGKVFTPLQYAPYVEYGTGLFAVSGGRQDVPWHYQDAEGNWHSTNGQKPQPFMIPALNECREDIISILEGFYNG